jgi:hypothetical protein
LPRVNQIPAYKSQMGHLTGELVSSWVAGTVTGRELACWGRSGRPLITSPESKSRGPVGTTDEYVARIRRENAARKCML